MSRSSCPICSKAECICGSDPPTVNSPECQASPRAVYVHVPFCRHRCGYCNFTVVAGRDDLMDRYLHAVDREMQALERPRPVDTLFIGGGTPTQLPVAMLQRLLERIGDWFPPSPGYEWTVEANPADLRDATLDALAEAGVTRLSLGGQSFDERKLKLLERDHRGLDVRDAVQRARSRFASLSMDLIFGTPGESEATWLRDLQTVCELPIDHVSCYGLTFERGTRFWSRLQHGELQALDERLDARMYQAAIERLTTAGFEHYEVSNFARSGHRCRHNQVYWRGEPYFAVGPGAARYVDGRREVNHRSTTTYLRRMETGQSPVAESERLAPEDMARERLVFGLRMLQGVRRDWFQQQTGFELDALVRDCLPQLITWGLLLDDGQTLRLSRAGLMVSDSVWPYLLRPTLPTR